HLVRAQRHARARPQLTGFDLVEFVLCRLVIVRRDRGEHERGNPEAGLAHTYLDDTTTDRVSGMRRGGHAVGKTACRALHPDSRVRGWIWVLKIVTGGSLV